MILSGRRIYGGVVHPFTKFFDFWLCSLRYEKDFCQCYYLRHPWLKFFIFQISGKWFPWHPKQEYVLYYYIISPINQVFFIQIGHCQGLETLYVQSSRHARIMIKVLKHIWHFWHTMTKSNQKFRQVGKKMKKKIKKSETIA